MKVRIQDNVWTHLDWWTQLVRVRNKVALRNLDNSKKIESELKLVENENIKKLIDLISAIEASVMTEKNIFDVESWLNSYQEKPEKSTGELNV